ncbi:MAG: DUF4169 family protein [Gemmatimonas sp.]
MADIINLKDVRKARARALAETKAAENRTRFGRTREERTRQSIEDSRARREHEGNKIERRDERPSDDPTPPGKPAE